MPQTYLSPGVYIEEGSQGVAPIQPGSTNRIAFIGITSEASRKVINPETGEPTPVESVLGRAIFISNFTQYKQYFGERVPGAFLYDAVKGYVDNGGNNCYVISIFAANDAAPEAKRSRKGKAPTEETPVDVSPSFTNFPPLSVEAISGDPLEHTGLASLPPLPIPCNIICCPDAYANYDGSDAAKERVKGILTTIVAHCELDGRCMVLLDTPPELNAQQAAEWCRYLGCSSRYAAMYYPWISVDDSGKQKLIPPSGHIAGIYSRSDAERGVHKAPANEIVRGALNLEMLLSRPEQDLLNPLGVNCIRQFANGIRVWGARTQSPGVYVSDQRVMNMVKSAIETGLEWVPFEPNDKNLWERVKRQIKSFLFVLWSGGVFFGTTPEQAFYVKCDEELNPPEMRELGRLIIEVGIAIVKPAEFVIVKVQTIAGQDAQQ